MRTGRLTSEKRTDDGRRGQSCATVADEMQRADDDRQGTPGTVKCSELGQITNRMTHTPRSSSGECHCRPAIRTVTGRRDCAVRENVAPGVAPETAWTLGRLWGTLAPIGYCYCEQTAWARLDTEGRRGEPEASKVTGVIGVVCASYNQEARVVGVSRKRSLFWRAPATGPTCRRWNRGGSASRRGWWPGSLAGTALPPAPWRRTSRWCQRAWAAAFRTMAAERRPWRGRWNCLVAVHDGTELDDASISILGSGRAEGQRWGSRYWSCCNRPSCPRVAGNGEGARAGETSANVRRRDEEEVRLGLGVIGDRTDGAADDEPWREATKADAWTCGGPGKAPEADEYYTSDGPKRSRSKSGRLPATLRTGYPDGE